MMYKKEKRRVGFWISILSTVYKKRSFVLFGASENTKVIIGMLRHSGIEPDFVIDNDCRKTGISCSGIPTITVDEFLKKKKCPAVVLMYSAFYKEMMRQLKQEGFSGKVFNLFNTKILESSYISGFFRAELGFLMYRQILKNTKASQLFICPYTGTGDAYLAAGMLEEYVEKKGIDKYTLAVISGACKKAAMYHIKEEIVIVSDISAKWMIAASLFFKEKMNVYVLNDSWSTVYMNPIQWMRGFKGLNFADMFRICVFDDEVKNIKVPERRTLQQKDIEEYKLRRDKTVILAPYSNTLSEIKGFFWEGLADILLKEGYRVFTNSAGEREPVIRKTEKIFFPLNQAIEIVEEAGIFIGVRSGLCDIISSARCKKIILYEKNNFFYEGSTYDYFSLNKMRLCDNAYELIYDGKKNGNELQKRIVDILKGEKRDESGQQT